MAPTIRRILLIDDDIALCALMAEFFSANEFQIEALYEGDRGLARALENQHDLVILDVMLSGMNGIEVLKQLRRRSSVPVILLTARTDQQDRINGLDAGADDYLSKPFGPHELLARVRAVLRRSDKTGPDASAVVQIGDLKLYSHSRELWNCDDRIALTSVEFDILDILMRSAGRIVSRNELAGILYHRESTPFERTIDVHISHLRKKLDSCNRASIRTIRGVGYLFALSTEGES